MRILVAIFSVLLIIVTLQDSFESIVLPRRVVRRFRLSRLFYVATWAIWSFIGRKMRAGNRREFYMTYYGPVSLVLHAVISESMRRFAGAVTPGWRSPALAALERSRTFETGRPLRGTTVIRLQVGDVIARLP